MSCNNCDCLDCTRNRGIAEAMNRSNDTGDDDFISPWTKAEPANDVQAKAWGTLVDHFLSHIGPMSPIRLVNAVCNSIRGLKQENRHRVFLQVERFVRESPKYEVVQGIGVRFKSAPIHDDYTCKGCGNNKCSTQEKSCWKCGRTIGT